MIPIIRERPASILLILRDPAKERCISALSKESGLTYLHTLNILSQFYNLGLIEYKKSGRKKIVFLTDKGRQVSSALNQLMELLQSE